MSPGPYFRTSAPTPEAAQPVPGSRPVRPRPGAAPAPGQAPPPDPPAGHRDGFSPLDRDRPRDLASANRRTPRTGPANQRAGSRTEAPRTGPTEPAARGNGAPAAQEAASRAAVSIAASERRTWLRSVVYQKSGSEARR